MKLPKHIIFVKLGLLVSACKEWKNCDSKDNLYMFIS